MPQLRFMCLCLLATMLSGCENEASYTSINPYRTGRILLLLEEREIEYRLGRDGVIRYPVARQADFEQAQKDAQKPLDDWIAVVVKHSQAKTITGQFDQIGVAYISKDLGHFILLTWILPTAAEPEDDSNPPTVDDGSIEITL